MSRTVPPSTLVIDGTIYHYFAFDHLDKQAVQRLPYALKILLENLLRHADQSFVLPEYIDALLNWQPQAEPDQEIAFVPARVLLQDFTGVPVIADLAAMRDAIEALGGSPAKINPLAPVELVIDHSVMVDFYGTPTAFFENTDVEIERNRERYQFLRWGQKSFDNFKVVPPGTGIVHQVNLEYLARCVCVGLRSDMRLLYPDTLVGTDSHTTMVNGLGVLGWGVGGIEAEAAMLGQPISMLLPQVVGMRLRGKLPVGATATDLVLTITEILRKHGVVGKFVEFFGEGLGCLPLADRATIANMAPEYGATCGIFPVDFETINYLRLTGRNAMQLQMIEQYNRQMGLWHDADSIEAEYSAVLDLDLSTVEPSIAGPSRPQDRVPLKNSKRAFAAELQEYREQQAQQIATDNAEKTTSQKNDLQKSSTTKNITSAEIVYRGETFSLQHGAVVIAAITSCTNTSNPSVLMAAGLLAKNARAKGLRSKPWVKTSLAPGSQVVSDYLHAAGLLSELEGLGFYLVGYGCTTCIGNSGPLPEEISAAVRNEKLLVASVLSGNRNFEGRIHPDVQTNYLASPPLVVAYALAGTMLIDFENDPLGIDPENQPVYLRDIWPKPEQIREQIIAHVNAALFQRRYANVYAGNAAWNALEVSDSERYPWPESSYVRQPPFFTGLTHEPPGSLSIDNARVLVKVGDSITTDHISPAGSIAATSPAGQYLQGLGIAVNDFNSYGSRRGNHEVMMRGTFANVRLKNQLAPGTQGSWTKHFPSGEQLTIFDAAQRYANEKVPLLVIAGKEYGTGSSRDWAAKGPALLGVRAVIAESFERIHRSNLVGMGILPLQFMNGESAAYHVLDGSEQFSIPAVKAGQHEVNMAVHYANGTVKKITLRIRIDTPNEFDYYIHGGILQFVLRKLATQ